MIVADTARSGIEDRNFRRTASDAMMLVSIFLPSRSASQELLRHRDGPSDVA